NGDWARTGQVLPELLEQMLADTYFQRAAPKSTGREYFHEDWLQQHLSRRNAAPADVQATLLELTARTIADALASCGPLPAALQAGGGGLNTGLLPELLQSVHGSGRVSTTAQLGEGPDWMEAVGFACLAWRSQQRRSGNLAAVTGARGERILGAIYPAGGHD